MKIIIINYRYFISGGPERYLFNIKEILEKNGHTVIPFSVKSDHNRPSEYDNFFLSPVGDGSEVYFKEYKKSDIKTVFKSFSRMFYSFEAKRKLNRLIRETNPDLIYVLQFQNKISASIFDAAKKNKIPVVHRISDFGHICANNIFYLYNKGTVCEKCLNGSRLNAVKNKCVQNSYMYSLIKVASLTLQDILRIRKKVAAFIIPSKFTVSKFVQFGVQPQKIFHIPTFFNTTNQSNALITYESFALYIGRVDQDKGLLTLVKAFENTDHSLVIVGGSSTKYDLFLKDYLKDKKHNIQFLGQLDFAQIEHYLSKCLFTVCPSECYDNLPNTALESFAYKKMVIASKLGSLTELIQDNDNGLLFKVGDYLELRDKVNLVFNDQHSAVRMGNNAYKKIGNEYSPEKHYSSLLSVFNFVLNERNN
jgi:glycosyltransferase involved in cell wall biosynthesis